MDSKELPKIQKKDLIEQYKVFRKEIQGLSGSTKYFQPTAHFLGPKAENAQLFKELVNIALETHFSSRKYNCRDVSVYKEGFKDTPEFIETAEQMRQKTTQLSKLLTRSIPFTSLRYMAHMHADLTMASVVGYIAGMLYNQNNVTSQASPVTTWLEMAVINDLCRMIGFQFPSESHNLLHLQDHISPSGHLTSGGTVANDEAMWSASCTKFIPLALAEAIRNEPLLAPASSFSVQLCNGQSKQLTLLDSWEALNISVDVAVGLPHRVASICGIGACQVIYLVKQYHLSTLGILSFFQHHKINEPLFIASGPSHYSIPKASNLLGFGTKSTKKVPVDEKGHMDLVLFREELRQCLVNHTPVIAVIAILGTTEESSVDDIDGILGIREEFRQRGLDFTIHVDAALGGYLLSCIRSDYIIEQDTFEDVFCPSATVMIPNSPHNNMDKDDPEIYCSLYLRKQLYACSRVDTITIDPHKGGYVPYSAGAICYRNSRQRDTLVHSAVYIGSSKVTSVGIYGIEGSKPGAAASAVYLSHSLIRTSKSGYGMIHKKCLLLTRLFYLSLLWMADETNNFVVHCITNPPSLAELKYLKAKITQDDGNLKPYQDIASDDKDLIQRLAEVGPDQNIVCYSFNFKTLDGIQNTDYQQFCQFNDRIYSRFSSIPQDLDSNKYDLILSNTSISSTHGTTFINAFIQRVGLVNVPQSFVSIPVLRSTIMEVFIDVALADIINTLKVEITNIAKEFQTQPLCNNKD
ncbi:pyridoxal phosphate-dependent decarboxylase family protein [Cavenderia fasciculata]|uniref:Pyridoxal phosphate-dependent decarboxylase family protein n=1 Tax=Cavenderia fasciculata TaxID=261658 RepID=F4QBJ6_CACFS|nr:pyridoxal phosphate-dependent decarboxylase family protein [Cavenderia fasciculata]EGG14968.1 pyridoxal phosphate-dependent decarboxylase family protein [Cavenderia fasciculata]|eukprot:XP_004351484.1 pyridoxal phosphate-dependent decarboxylase family protein [Cavenderia fasciculata]